MAIAIEKRQVYCFADEAGNFDFRPRTSSRNASRYFILTTLTTNGCSVGNDLLELRRGLTIEGHHIRSHFHASEDSQVVRDAVFSVLAQHDFRIDATIFEKAKAYAKVKADENYFYKLAWFLHLKHVAPIVGTMQRRPILLVAASLATKRRMEQFHDAVDDVAAQVYPGPITTGMWASSSDPCLWAVDYCSWAIQRMWEMSDARSYDLIKARISTEFDVWRSGQVQP